jgi:hypothetical protein
VIACIIALAPAAAHSKSGRDDAGRLLALGDSLLEAGDLSGAEAAYAAVSSWGWTSAALAHNRGLTALRAGREGEAIAYLVESRRLSHGNPAIQQSLAAARVAAGIAIRPPPESARLAEGVGSPSAIAGLILFAAVVGLLAVLQRRRREVAVILAVAAAGAWGVALMGWWAAAPRATVVVETTLRAGPAAASREEVALRPGRTVRLGAAHGEWRHARVPGGPAGWLPAAALR